MTRLIALLPALLICALQPPAFAADAVCVPGARWALPAAGTANPLETPSLVAALSRRHVVLLGEGHDISEHHRWQAQTVAVLHAQRPDLALGFEMFPRSAQPALDRWVAGELTEAEFLRATDWKRNWGYDPQMYLPIFHFARMNRVPMIALNIDRDLSRDIGAGGFDALPPEKRAGLSRPAAALAPYEDFLFESYSQHAGELGHEPARDDVRFHQFMDAQLLWDRAMAERIAAVFPDRPGSLVVALMGSGHVINGWGVPHQLRALGIADPAVLLPWEPENDCRKLAAGYADAVFGLTARQDSDVPKPRLGLWLELQDDAVAIKDIEQGGLGETAGLRKGDVLVEVAGRSPRQPGDVSEIVQRQAPGTWLPLKVRRDGKTFEIIAKFPPAAS